VSAAGTVLTPAQVYNVGMEATIDVIGLRKRFGATRALDGMSFVVGAGRVTGFIGPNGAGKTNRAAPVVTTCCGWPGLRPCPSPGWTR
jgi:ABC-type uncharacterized transport system ATPase subunit